MKVCDLAVVLAIGMLTAIVGCSDNQRRSSGLATPPPSVRSPGTDNPNLASSAVQVRANVSSIDGATLPVPYPRSGFPQLAPITPGVTDTVGRPAYTNLGGPPQFPGGPAGIP
jgi:hypothetical protein